MENIRYEYQVPDLGNLSGELLPIPSRCYRLMNAEIENLTRMLQLGVIQDVYKGVHHTKWEYVVIQVSLVNRLNDLKPATGLGLTSDIELSRKKISGAEIIQSWILLLNLGHLYGTFASEKALLKLLTKSLKIKRCFLSGISDDKQLKEWAESIISNEYIYKFHQIISLFRLHRKKRASQDDVKLFTEILKLYLIESDQYKEKRKNLLDLFRKIRRVSFLYLDSKYGPVPMDFHLGPILLNFQDYSEKLFGFLDSPIKRALDEFEKFMVKYVYMSKESMEAHGIQTNNVQRVLETKLKEKCSITALKEVFINQGIYERRIDNIKLEGNFQLWLEDDSKLGLFNSLKSISLENEWQKYVGRSNCMVTMYFDPRRESLGITISYKKNSNKIKVLSSVIRKTYELKELLIRKGKSNPSFKVGYVKQYIEQLFASSIQELVIEVLKNVIKPEYIIIPHRDPIHLRSWTIQRGTTCTSNSIAKLRNSISDSRRFEVEGLISLLKDLSRKGITLSTLMTIDVLNRENRKNKTDFDGVAVLPIDRGLEIYVLETKDIRKGRYAKAKYQLKSNLDDILSSDIEYSIHKINRFGAYAKFNIFN